MQRIDEQRGDQVEKNRPYRCKKNLPVSNCPIEVNPTPFVLEILEVSPPHRIVQEECTADRPTDHNGNGRPDGWHDHHHRRHGGGSRLRLKKIKDEI